MARADRPGWLGVWGSAVSGGLFGGTVVGVSEALYVLSSTTPSEYQALAYAVVLYGAAGACVGGVLGMPLGLVRGRVSVALGWSGVFFAVVLGGGALVAASYGVGGALGAAGVGFLLAVAVVGGTAFGVGVWITTIILLKTPLRVLPGAKGTVVAWLGIVALSRLFSLAPAPGAALDLAPHRPQPPEAATRPDVILVMVDSLRADALGAYGGPPGGTPALDALAADGVVFEQAITTSSWTRPAAASLYTSLLPSAHACSTKRDSLSPLVDTLAEVMQRSGYATGGLPASPHVSGARGFAQGFDYYPFEQVFPFGAAESTYALKGYTALRSLVMAQRAGKRVEDYYAPAEVQLERAWRYVEAQDGDRYFLTVHLMEPHDPYFAHPVDGEAYARSEHRHPDEAVAARLPELYRGEVAHLDAALGAFLDRLRASGRYDRTMVVVTADHGEAFGEHGEWWHGTSLDDEVVRVPLLVKLPAQARAGTRVPWQVRTMDVAPTVAEEANVASSPRWRGAPLFTDDFDRLLALPLPVEGAPPPAPLTWATHPASREAVSELDLDGLRLASLRTGGKKLVEALPGSTSSTRAHPAVALYDLVADPGELHNLADGQAEAPLRAWLERQLEQARAEAVVALGADLSQLDRARLEALGYLPSPAEE